jgi:hypothetical protein
MLRELESEMDLLSCDLPPAPPQSAAGYVNLTRRDNIPVTS